MSDTDAPFGGLFSRLYVQHDEPLQDSDRMRRRLHRLMRDGLDRAVADAIERELGVEIPTGWEGYLWERFFMRADVRDVLDTVTIVLQHDRPAEQRAAVPDPVVREINRIMREEATQYQVDENGTVHYFVDAEFAHNVNSLIAALQPARYAAACKAFEAALSALDRRNPSSKEALRNAFEAVEIVFKLMFGVHRLGGAEIRDQLLPAIENTYADDDTARRAAHKIAASFIDWVDGAHFYRHGQADEEPREPPLELTVSILSGCNLPKMARRNRSQNSRVTSARADTIFGWP